MLARRRSILSVLGALAINISLRNKPSAAKGRFVELDPNRLLALEADLQVVFCAMDLATRSVTVMNKDRIDDRHAPWSTFKIPNLIIAMETKPSLDLGDRRIWDKRLRPPGDHWPRSWQQDQSLATAFKRSVVWYFQDIAKEVGTERYRLDLARFGYGNASVPESSDDFWLGGPLAISPLEQTWFLKQVLDNSLDISRRARHALRTVSLVKTSDGYALYGKTGSGPLRHDQPNGPFEGWFVGWVEQGKTPIATFALYLSGPDYRSLRSARRDVSEVLLQAAGYLPADWK